MSFDSVLLPPFETGHKLTFAAFKSTQIESRILVSFYSCQNRENLFKSTCWSALASSFMTTRVLSFRTTSRDWVRVRVLPAGLAQAVFEHTHN